MRVQVRTVTLLRTGIANCTGQGYQGLNLIQPKTSRWDHRWE